MGRIHDISLPIGPDLPTFPGNPGPTLTPVLRQASGDETNVTLLSIGTHAGTHVDAPAHLVDGASGVDHLALDVLVGDALVIDARDATGHIDALTLARVDLPAGAERLLLQTRNSAAWDAWPAAYPNDYVGLTPDGARWLVEHGIRLVGIDGLSIEPFATPGRPTHRALLDAGVVIVEGLDLRTVEAGIHRLVCLPLRIVGADGAPARAILIERD